MVKAFRFMLTVIVFTVFLCSWLSSAANGQFNIIKRVEYRKTGGADSADKNLFHSSLAFYLEREPMVHALPSAQPVVGQRVFFLPHAEIDRRESAQIARVLTQVDKQLLTFKIEEVQVPLKGVKVTILFNPELIHIAAMPTFDDADNLHKVVFNFYDERVLTRLRMHERAMLEVACGDHNKEVVNS